MRCSHCGVCCEKTEMLLSKADIRLLESARHERGEFVRVNRQGFAQLRNRRGHCVFYQTDEGRCGVYRYRPLGCRIYPVIYSVKEGVVVDDLCPLAETVSQAEIDSKAERLMRLLRRIDSEAEKLRTRE
ncbi:MAG: YkgJ family cysteine cluster protein [Candidatus Bathyarchaeia archaeon]